MCFVVRHGQLIQRQGAHGGRRQQCVAAAAAALLLITNEASFCFSMTLKTGALVLARVCSNPPCPGRRPEIPKENIPRTGVFFFSPSFRPAHGWRQQLQEIHQRGSKNYSSMLNYNSSRGPPIRRSECGRYPGPGVQLHVRARFSDLRVNSILPLPTSRADREPPKGMG